MSDTVPPHQPDDEIVSAVLDGEATHEQQELLRGDVVAQQRLQAFVQVRAALAAPSAPSEWTDRAVAAALAALAPTELATSAGVEGAAGEPAITPVPLASGSTRALVARRRSTALRALGGLAAAAAVVIGIVSIGHRTNDTKSADAPQHAGFGAPKSGEAASATTAAAAAASAAADQSQPALGTTGASETDTGTTSGPGGAIATSSAGARSDGATAIAASPTGASTAAPAITATSTATSATSAGASPGNLAIIGDPPGLRAWVTDHPASATDTALSCASVVSGATAIGRVIYQGVTVQVFTQPSRVIALDDTTCATTVDISA